MTNEDREDLKRAIRKVLNDEPARMSIADRVLNEFDAKLSPKYPPKGALCEVWMDAFNEGERRFAMSAGDGSFYNKACNGGAQYFWDHWRVIPRAEDALAAVNARSKVMYPTSAPMPTTDFDKGRMAGLLDADYEISKLIDNAEHS